MTLLSENNSISTHARWWMAAVLFLAAFMNLLDATIVNLALPAIQENLNATATQLQWVLVAYILTFAAGLLPFGRFGDVFGRDRMFIWGLSGFMVSSAACGLSPTIELLITSRAIQGLTAAMMVPQVLAIIHVVFPPEDKGKAIGLYGMISGLGAVAGPIIGGFLVSADLFGLGWRPIFLINLPLGLLALFGTFSFVPKVQSDKRIKADWVGAALFAIAIISLTYPLVEGRALGWPLWAFGLMLLSLVLCGWFVRRQMHLADQERTQTLPVSLMKDGSFVGGLVVSMLFFSGIAGVVLMMAIFMQSGFGFSPAEAGLALVPHPASAMIASLITGRLGARWLNARISYGALALLIGMVWLRTIVGSADTSLIGVDFIVPMMLIGSGMGTAAVALFQSILSRVAGPDAGAGSGVLQAIQQFSLALGIALIGQIFFATLGPAPDQMAYVTAARTALWLPIGIYASLCLICLWQLVTPKETTNNV